MSIDKSEIKILTANNIGASIDDQLERSQRTVHQLEGAVQSLQQASKLVPLNIVAKVDRDVEAGKITEGMPLLKIVEAIKKNVIRCGDYLEHLSEVEKNKIVSASGEVVGLKAALAVVKKTMDKEKEKVSEILADAESLAKGGNGKSVEVPRTASDRAKAAHGSLADRRAKAALKKSIADKPESEMTEEELELHLLG